MSSVASWREIIGHRLTNVFWAFAEPIQAFHVIEAIYRRQTLLTTPSPPAAQLSNVTSFSTGFVQNLFSALHRHSDTHTVIGSGIGC